MTHPTENADRSEPVMTKDPLAHSGLLFSGDEYDDGYMNAAEVLGLDLRGVELVTLSACESGVGLVQGDEGVIGLKRSFLAAGARSLVLSLWSVPDAPTRDLIVAFFEGIRMGRPKAEALRRAKLKIMKRTALEHRPYYWAAFVLVGEQ